VESGISINGWAEAIDAGQHRSIGADQKIVVREHLVAIVAEYVSDFLSVTRDAGGHQQASDKGVKFCLHSFSFFGVNDSVKIVSCY
jgi:hypothetical protein